MGWEATVPSACPMWRAPWSLTANHGEPKPLLRGLCPARVKLFPSSRPNHVPPAGLDPRMVAGLHPKVIGYQLHGYPVASAAEGSKAADAAGYSLRSSHPAAGRHTRYFR
jgi:hypothetical protein